MKILLVEDSRVTRQIIISCLKTTGDHEILESWDGTAALPLVKNNPDLGLILTDWNMPVMGGIEFVREVRAFMPKVPIVMITIESAREDVLKAVKAGVSGYVSKPFTAAILRDKLSPFLNPPTA